ncbi:MAG TPA: C25 family cysteine peptidase [Verrucomicrobiae bacterium]|nr:C25 family cysteine peptidase [Verrucomicrobiae bacterium]
MIDQGADSRVFEEVVRELLKQGLSVRFQAQGASMSPTIRDGEMVEVTPVIVSKLRKDDIVLTKSNHGFRLHRIVLADHDADAFVTRGDCGRDDDPVLKGSQILGLAQSKEVRLGRRMVRARLNSVSGRVLRGAARSQRLTQRLLDRMTTLTSRGRKALRKLAVPLALLLVVLAAHSSNAQVAVDSSSSGTAALAGTGTRTLTFTHTTANVANRVLVVGVSINITNNNATAVSNVTYNGVGLTKIGVHNDTSGTRRVEMWYLLAPANGTHNVVVSVTIPSGVTVGVVGGATTLTGVDQTVPLGSFVSADGAAGTYSQLDVPSVVNGMILDTLATDGTQTITVSGPQTQEWNARSANSTNPGVRGTGSSRSGAPSVPISETFSGTSNWSLGAVSINPTTADIGVSTSVSAVALGQNSTYNITVTNNGLSAAHAVTLTDTLAASGLTLVSVTPSAGTTCTGSGPITCTLPDPFNSGATATVAVTVTASAAGFYPNTATVADSGTPPDPNTGNNTYVSLAPVVSVVCAVNTLSAGGTLSGVLNTYYPGTANVAAGATSIPVGTPTGAGGAIANGSLLLVIQMQDASINTSNSVAYGNGYTGSGFTTINNAGNYEFVKATGPVSGGSVPITGAGSGGGLVFGYTAAADSATKGQSTYQVVLVPQYLSATLGAVTASAWNGSTGGVLALDIAGQLNLGGTSVSVDGLGFRGGAGMQLTGGAGNNTDYRVAAPATYTGAAEAGADAPKGEGVAGTPEWVESGTTYLASGSNYPSGSAADGSMAQGAPGNAGGGGTDGDPANNDQNAGGGGGSNGGSGGTGGDSWNTNLSSGGEGASSFPATIDRIALGGGGGGGTRNNSDGDTQASSGAAGGGIIFIRADSLTGTATLTANGANAYNLTANDAGGGGGAGGTIVILSANGGEGGLTLNANGGAGGNAWLSQPYSLANRHGPGGGGGGGVIFVSGSPAGASVSGGASGLTLNTPSVAYGATAGSAGTTATTATLSQVTGIQSASLCSPDLTLGKSHVGNFTRGSNASYTIPVSNVSAYGATSGLVTMNDTLPVGLTPTNATGTGWTCSASGQTISCTRSDSVVAGGSYPSITLNAAVAQTAPATVTNTATIGGGNEANLLNDMATDVANVVSSADLSVTDAASPNPVAAGSNITYTQVVTNNGPSAADNATLIAPIPTNTTLVSMTAPAGWSCASPGSGGTGNVVCTNVNMAALTTGTFTLIVKVNSGTANGTVIADSVSVNSSIADPNSANNTATASTLVGTSGPDLTVTNSALPNPVQAGSNITYTQVVTNTGSSAATTATFTESTPANTTFVSITPPAGWTCTAFPPQCTNPSVAAGASGAFTVVYKVTAGTASGTTITDTATVNAANQSFGSNSATATDVVASATQADLALSTTATPSTVFAGNNITYTQAITNNGPATATSLSFTEATPTNTTFASVSAPAGWTCTTPAVGATGTVNCTATSLAVGTEADIIVAVNVPASTAAGTITASSSVTAATGDPTTANNSTTVATPLIVVCDLSVTNSGTPSPVTAGNNITYTQVVTNSGPSNCSTATLNEATPANTTFVSVAVVTSGGGTWTCPNTAPIACTNPSVPPGSTATITAIYKVTAGTAGGTIITDTATAATTSRDTYPGNNSATVNIPVASATQADLSVTNAGSPNPVSAGNNITYTQSVSNAGSATATTVSFTDPVPANTTAVSLTGPAGWTCSIATTPPSCTIASLAVNTTANFTYVVTVGPTVAAGTTITETDSVTSATTDPVSGNNSATVNVQVAGAADLSVTNTANPVPVQAGANIIYAQVVSNGGPSTATSVTVTETLPANTTAVSLTGPAGWTCSLVSLTCTNPSFASGTPANITFVVKVTAGTASGTPINDTVSASSAVSDPNSANNSATAADVVATAAQADLVTTDSASPTTVAAGGNVTYSQSVTNKGPAAASGVTFTQTTPPNTTFQSITPPAGWTCGTVPAVGGTGAITCTDAVNLAVNGTANFSLILQVNSSTPSGTYITETDTATATNIVPSLTSNSAQATVVVANANSADVAIVKTATPNPVTQGTPLTYTLAVTNNGPASATNVTVTDTLPSVVTYLSSTTTQGSCSEAGGTVTCLLGTMASGDNETVSILTIPGSAGIVSNTATVSADQTDPVPSNNSSTQTETITAPTTITLQSFSAHLGTDKSGANRVVLTWKTGGEARNLGFNVYREVNGNRVRVNPSMIAGSALLMSGALPRHSGRSYAWIDPSVGTSAASYWLEDIDVNGLRTLNGPVNVQGGLPSGSDVTAADTRMFSQISQAQASNSGSEISHRVEGVLVQAAPSKAQMQKQFELAANPGIKIFVRNEGWYRVAQPDLVKAGLDPNVDPSRLHLYAKAIEQPMQITAATPGPGGFGSQASINFYGTGIDTEFSGTRVYWLVTEGGKGARVPRLQPSAGSNQPPASFAATLELRQHTTYFAALLTQDGQNFFGALVSPTSVDQVLNVLHLDTGSLQTARLEVILQGVIVGFPHDVEVALNGTPVGDVTFTGQAKGTLSVDVPPGSLQEGNNTVTLTAQNGDYDTSLVQSIRITYPHRYQADSDALKFTGRAGDELTVGGFSSAPTVLDITDPDRPVQVTPQVASSSGKFTISLQVPWTTTNPATPTRHALLAVADDRIASAASVLASHPSHWHNAQTGADIAMITNWQVEGPLDLLVRKHQAEGKSSVVIRIGDLYDEFNFGERSPYVIRQFLQSAKANWSKAPAYLLLNGRASLDPRNYLGFGNLDLVPTRIIPGGSLMTASDDWFSDFNDSGMPTIATGRLPVTTLDEAKTVISKIVAYEGKSTNGPWTSQALMVADNDDTENFSDDSQVVQSQFPSSVQATDVFTSVIGSAAARQSIIDGINSGQLLVNYLGHGSEDQWSGSDLLDSNTVNSLTNGSQLPVFLIMDCLNGFFQDVYSQPLGVTLLLAPNGGAVAVLASTGLNQPAPQTSLDKLVVQSAFGASRSTLGDAILKAKSQIGDVGVRQTYVLFGDPAMLVKQPAASSGR